MDTIILYSTNCPKCIQLKNKLQKANLRYIECNDEQIMIEKGLTSCPALEVNGKLYNYKESIKFINNQEAEE